MNHKSLNKIIPFVAMLLLLACANSKHAEDKTMKKPNPPSSSIIWVNSYKSDCSGLAQVRYFLFTQEGNEKPTNNWDCLYETIQGFTFEPGYICQLKVEILILEGKPALKLVEVVSKERDPDYFRIYDLWAVTHIGKKVLDVSATRPNMEINLSTMKVMGKGMCNQYFGKIIDFNTSFIQFGTIAGTKMICPEMDIETGFLQALERTQYYEIKKLTLFFFDENKQEVLRFQKID